MVPESQQNFHDTLECLLDMDIVPILNTNDVHSSPPQQNIDLRDVSKNNNIIVVYNVVIRWKVFLTTIISVL